MKNESVLVYQTGMQEVENKFLDIRITLATYINSYLLQEKLSYRDAAKITGISKSTIEHTLQLKSDNFDKLLLIALKLGFKGEISISIEKPVESKPIDNLSVEIKD